MDIHQISLVNLYNSNAQLLTSVINILKVSPPIIFGLPSSINSFPNKSKINSIRLDLALILHFHLSYFLSDSH
jgi:hypothetical protein